MGSKEGGILGYIVDHGTSEAAHSLKRRQGGNVDVSEDLVEEFGR